MRAWLAVTCLTALATVPAEAEKPAAGAQQPGAQVAVLDVVVNGISRGTSVVQLVPDGDGEVGVEVERELLETLGLTALLGPDPGPISLRTLAPSLTYEVREADVSLQLTVAPAVYGAASIDLTQARQAAPLIRSSSAFLNYRVDYTRALQGGATTVSAPLELGINAGRWHLSNDFTYVDRDGARRLDRHRIVALLDQPEQSSSWSVGETTAAGGRLGGAASIAGITRSSNFSLRPELLRVAGAAFDLELDVPAELEVRVNGATIRTIYLQPGLVRLDNLVLPSGSADVELVLRDELGRERRIEALLFGSSRLLRPGVHEYSYGVGLQRGDLSGTGFNYGDPVGIAFHRVGLGRRITAGARLEATRGVASGGASAAVLFGSLGEVETGFGYSSSDLGVGHAGFLDYRFVRRGLFMVLGGRLQTERYATVANATGAEASTASARGSVGTSLPGIGFFSGDFVARRVAHDWSTLVGGRFRGVLGRSTSIDLALARGTGDRQGWEFSATLTMLLSNRSSARLTAERREGRNGQRLALFRSTPVGTGISYRLDVERRDAVGGAQTEGSGSVRYRGRLAEMELRFRRSNDRDLASARLAGALTWMGGSMHVSRPITRGFALVRVGDLEGVEVRFRNRPVGRTGRSGTLFLPELSPYSHNRIQVTPRDLPLEIELPETRQIVATPFRGGGIVDFPVQRFQSFVGKILVVSDDDDPRLSLVAGEPKLAEFAQLSVETGADGGPLTTIVGRDGLMYLENLSPGDYDATVTLRGRACSIVIEIPDTDGVRIDLGEIACRLAS